MKLLIRCAKGKLCQNSTFENYFKVLKKYAKGELHTLELIDAYLK